MNLEEFIESILRLPKLCGWSGCPVGLEEIEYLPGCVYVNLDIHMSAINVYELYSSFYEIISTVESIFEGDLINSEISENDDDYAPYRLTLEVRYKEVTTPEEDSGGDGDGVPAKNNCEGEPPSNSDSSEQTITPEVE